MVPGLLDDEGAAVDERRRQAMKAVRAYLVAEFPGSDVEEIRPDTYRDARGFRVGGVAAPVVVSSEFLDDTEPGAVGRILGEWNLAERMRTAGKGVEVVVTRGGIGTESLRGGSL